MPDKLIAPGGPGAARGLSGGPTILLPREPCLDGYCECTAYLPPGRASRRTASLAARSAADPRECEPVGSRLPVSDQLPRRRPTRHVVRSVTEHRSRSPAPSLPGIRDT